MTGEFLPPQMLYAGKTNRCHPAVEFRWDVHHTENHWSNAASMNRHVDTIVIPFMERTRILLGLPNEQKGLAIFDVFRAHQDKTMLDKLHTNNIKCVFVPACCTDRLQPLDLSVNKDYKDELKGCFQQWYSNEVTNQISAVEDIEGEVDFSKIHVDFRTSQMKRDMLVSGFHKPGITSMESSTE